MCGITAIIGQNPDSQTLDAMLTIASRRGPEKTTSKKLDDMLLGHTQLAFVDIGSNSQPYQDFDGSIITYNGEIYNWEHLNLKYSLEAKNDTQTLIRGLKKLGVTFLKEIDNEGQFAFIAKYKDAKGKTQIVMGRDKWGISPLCYGLNNAGQIIIGSTPETVKKGGVNPSQLRTLPAGCYGQIEGSNVDITSFYVLPNTKNTQKQRFNPQKILEKAITQVEIRIPKETQVLYTTMGGIDSQFVTATVARKTKGDFGGAITIVPWDPKNQDGMTGGDYYEACATVEMLKNEGINLKHHVVQLTPSYIDSALDRILAVLGPDYFNVCCGLAEDLVATTAKKLGGKAIMTAGGPDEAGRSYKPWTLKHKDNLEEGFYAVSDQFASSEGVRAGLVFGESGIENRVPLAFLIEDSMYMISEQKQQITNWGDQINPFTIEMKDKIAWRQALEGYLPKKSLSKPKETIHGSTGAKSALYHLSKSDDVFQKERNEFITQTKKAGHWEELVYGDFDNLNPENEITEGQIYCLWRWSKLEPASFKAGCKNYFGLKEDEQFRYSSDIEQKSRRPVCHDWKNLL